VWLFLLHFLLPLAAFGLVLFPICGLTLLRAIPHKLASTFPFMMSSCSSFSSSITRRNSASLIDRLACEGAPWALASFFFTCLIRSFRALDLVGFPTPLISFQSISLFGINNDRAFFQYLIVWLRTRGFISWPVGGSDMPYVASLNHIMSLSGVNPPSCSWVNSHTHYIPRHPKRTSLSRGWACSWFVSSACCFEMFW